MHSWLAQAAQPPFSFKHHGGCSVRLESAEDKDFCVADVEIGN